MGLIKCPRCELNYILDNGALCTVCREEVRGNRSTEDVTVLCSACGEYPVMPGEDMCKACLLELRSIDVLSTDREEEPEVDAAELGQDPVSGLDEIESVEDLDADEDADEDEDEDADEDESDEAQVEEADEDEIEEDMDSDEPERNGA